MPLKEAIGFIMILIVMLGMVWYSGHYGTETDKVPVSLSFSDGSSTPTPATGGENFQTDISDGTTTRTSVVSETDLYQVNLSQEEVVQVNRSIQNFTQSLWEGISKYGYDNVTLTLAASIAALPLIPECENLSGYKNLSVYNERVSNLTVALYKYKNLAEGLSKDYGIELPYLDDKEIGRLKSSLSPSQVEDMLMTCSLARDYNRLVMAARQVTPGDESTYTEFYERLFIVGVELIFMKENVAYKVSYKLVGNIMWKTHLFHVIYRFGGSTALKIVMSTMHWESRGLINKYFEAFSEDPGKIEELISHIDDPSWIYNQVNSVGEFLKNKTTELIGNRTGIVDKLKGFLGSDGDR